MSAQAKNFENGARTAESTVAELSRIIAQAEDLLKSLSEEGGAAAEAVRQRVMRTVSHAKARIADTSARVRASAIDAGRATNEYVQDNPWKSIAYGAAAGAAIALIATAFLRRD